MLERFLRGLLAVVTMMVIAGQALSAPYAALVMDARTGKVLHARNADTRLHPASLTKMMTLYVAFEAIERGEISADTKVKISRHAASEPPSKLGLKSGQTIKMRYLIRAAAVKSANDAATAIAEAISGSEAAFARRMTATAKAMGMKRTTFKNAHGLTQRGHMSTARDMALLGRRLFYDHPGYYHIFSRRTVQAGNRAVYSTNRKFLGAYRGADGIKTGYTRAAGYNLVGSAERGNERIIASLFGGKNSSWRNARMAELLDLGFKRAPSRAKVIRPTPLGYVGNSNRLISQAIRPKKISPILKRAGRPMSRPGSDQHMASVENLVARANLDEEIESAVAAAVAQAARKLAPIQGEGMGDGYVVRRPKSRDDHLPGILGKTFAKAAPLNPTTVPVAATGSRKWSVHLGSYSSRREAERLLLVAALAEVTSLDGAYRKIEPVREGGRRMYRARFVGLTEQDAIRACTRLSAKSRVCIPQSPGT